MTNALGILLAGVLFALFGMVRSRGCKGGCERCGESCERRLDHE